MSARQPLLQTTTKTSDDGATTMHTISSATDYQQIARSQCHEICIILQRSLPIFLSVFCEWLPELVAFISVGHCLNSAYHLCIVAMAYTFYNFILFLIWGLLSGLYTLIQNVYKQSYEHTVMTSSSSSGHDESDTSQRSVRTAIEYYISLYSQRAFMITLLASVPFMALLSYGGTILVYWGVSDVYEVPVNFVCMQLIVTLYIEVWRSITQRITESLPDRNHITLSLFYCNVCTALLSLPVSWFFIFFLHLSYQGFVVVITLCNAVNLLLMITVLCCKRYAFVFKPLPLHRVLRWKGIKEYLAISIPQMLVSLFEMSTSYLIVLLCAFMVNPNVAVCTAVIVINIMRFIQFIFTGLSYALSLRMDGYIYMECASKYGTNEMVLKAKQTRNIGYAMMLVLNAIISCVLYFGKTQILYIFINNARVTELCMVVLDVLIVHSFFMAFEYLLSAIFRASGEPFVTWPARIILYSYYIVPFPVMLILLYYFDFKSMLYRGVITLFALFAVSKIICVVVMQLLIWCNIHWNTIVDEKYKTFKTQLQDSI